MGKINRIQLRGISRTPSDRMNEDGGVAESLNMYIDEAESAPALAPVDVTSELGLPDDLVAEKVFIHKGNSYENIIVATHQEILSYIGGKKYQLYTLSEEEAVTDVASVGNTVIVSTNQGPLYFLLKEGVYHFLGRQIPFPTIEFYDAQVKAIKKDKVVHDSITTNLIYPYSVNIYDEDGAEAIDAYMEFLRTSDFNSIYGATHFTEDFWNDLDTNNRHKKEMASSLFESVKSKWQEMIAKNAEKGIFCKSFWAVYGISLYDGSLLISTPQLLSPGEASPIDVCARGKWFGHEEEGYTGGTAFLIRLNNYFRLGIKLHDFNSSQIESWKDIIKSVDVYISEDVNSADYVSMTLKEAATKVDDDTYLAMFNLNKNYEESYVSAALSKSQFVKVEEFAVSDKEDANSPHTIADLRNGYVCDSKRYVINADRLSGRDLLSSKQYDIKQSLYVSDKVFTYNQNLYWLGAHEVLSAGTKWFNAQRFNVYLPVPLFEETPNYSDYPKGWFENPWREKDPSRDNGILEAPQRFDMKISYYVSNTNGSAVIYGRSANESKNFTAEYGRYALNFPSVKSWIIYPNPNCKYAEIEIKENGLIYKRRVEMTPHPFFPMCSYWYGGDEDLNVTVASSNDFDSFKTESRTIDVSNKIISSPSENPFINTIGSAQEFQSRVLGVAIASTALSQGQFGQFPLYVFTEDGIWAMETAADGSFVTSKPLSRDVCVNPDSITSIDSAVVFVTDKGVMLLQGSQVVNISPNMNGKHYTMEESAKVLVNAQNGFKDLVPVVKDDTHFMAFVKDATISYDYSGKRLIFIKDDEAYQYIYKLDTNTWHKTAYGVKITRPLNSYPEALVQAEAENLTEIILYIEDGKDGREQTFDLFYAEVENLGILPVETWESMFFDGTNATLKVTDEKKAEIDVAAQMATVNAGVTLSYDETEKRPSTHIYNLSTPLDVESQDPVKGIIVTRPFDLGAPDVHKTIIDLRVRGNYERGAVKFILLGSMDGIHFNVINTRRGKSWKLFRLVILADLKPTERISWIDVEYEERMTNRLR